MIRGFFHPEPLEPFANVRAAVKGGGNEAHLRNTGDPGITIKRRRQHDWPIRLIVVYPLTQVLKEATSD